ncbi:HET-domain-containing protein [Cubamyces sp. BRFM 1775]|nr:HET-domain-containing protein [Cubamyces sp. BRFM 1775]
MWLIRTDNFALQQVNNPENISYAILSHVWDIGGEQSFQDIQKIHEEERRHHGGDDSDAYREAVRRRISPKVRSFCDAASKDDFTLGWIDTCCIDKQSSAELSEAINSMYAWYAHADICYAYLRDVPDDEDPLSPYSAFLSSAWFTRGWTLQELIAPKNVMFLSARWSFLGTKNTLSDTITTVTGISAGVLNHAVPLDSVPVATRMSWASKRVTTRVEDEAYSLMGVFGVNMPTLYGEGRSAFTRLQEEILKRIPDQSLFYGRCQYLLGLSSTVNDLRWCEWPPYDC